MTQLNKIMSLIAYLVLAMSILFAGPALAAKAKTEVKFKITQPEHAAGVAPANHQYQYLVRLLSERDGCRKRRKVLVYHDENGNRTLDVGEFVIGEGRTNRRRGRLKVLTSIGPVYGDRVGVLVPANKKCKRGRASRIFHFGKQPV